MELKSNSKKPTGSWLSPDTRNKLMLLTIFAPIPLINLIDYVHWTKLVVGLLVIMMASPVIWIYVYFKKRATAMKVFDKGNVPSVARRHLISGHMIDLYGPASNYHLMDLYHKKLGKTYGAFFGPEPWILSTDLDLLQRVFVTDAVHSQYRNQGHMPFTKEFNKSLAQVQGEEWRRARHALNPSFTIKQMKSDNVLRDIDDISSRLLSSIDSKTTTTSDEKSPSVIIDVLDNFHKYSMEVIFKVSFGRTESVNLELEAKEPLVGALHESAKAVKSIPVTLGIYFPPIRHFFSLFVNFTPIGKLLKQIHTVLEKSLNSRRELSQVESRTSYSSPHQSAIKSSDRKMIDTFIELIDTNQMDEESLKANLFFLFVAGFETTANTLTAMFWLLARHPRAQDKLREDLCQNGENSQYLDLCLKETLRLFPVVPEAIGRMIQETFTHNGMTFFKGTSVLANIYSIHRAVEYWGEDIEEFRPERFGESFKHPAQFFAFGMGPRRCIGGNLAMIEMRAIVTKVLLRYRVETCDTTPHMIDFTTPNLFHMIFEGPINLKFAKISSL